MPETNIDSAVASDLSNTMTDWSVIPQETDAAGAAKEYEWTNTNWSKYLGYYKSIPELQAAVDAKANWTIGAGFEADEITQLLLNNIKGNGKDSFNSILGNMIRTYTFAGDAFAEVMRDDDKVLVNLKPLDAGAITIVHNSKGRVLRYEQKTKLSKNKKVFQPHEIFHLSRKRIADEIHGISVIESVEWVIQARHEAMTDWKKVLHRNVQPIWIFHLDTDDTTQIATFKSTMDNAREDGENMYIPKDAVVPELAAVAPNATMNPLQWIDRLNDYFFQAVNVPQIIIGNAKEFTDASAKVTYLAFEQSVKEEQLYIEEQVLGQLNIYIELTFPASLEQGLISDVSKSPSMQAAQPNDQMVEMEGKK